MSLTKNLENIDVSDKILSYLIRLKNGEELEAVRNDFVKEFQNVKHDDIVKAEQKLINDGYQINELKKLCDFHSRLFHKNKENYINKNEIFEHLTKIDGHPLQTFYNENLKILSVIAEIKNGNYDKLTNLKDISIHYAKKGDLLYPLLKVEYNVIGPANVMWSVDDDIKDELNKVIKNNLKCDDVIKKIEEMVYKENNILFPICAANFTLDEWYQIYFDSLDYDDCLGVENIRYDDAIENMEEFEIDETNIIRLPTGNLSYKELNTMLNTIPIEITLIDKLNINRYFNDSHKIFKRGLMALNRDVFSCHPPKIEPMVRSIIDSFKMNIKDKVEVMLIKNDKPYLVSYIALRDNFEYIGTIELIYDLSYFKKFLIKDDNNEG